MKVIIKRAIKGYLKNPIFWIGILIIVAGIFQQLEPYLGLHYISSEQEISNRKEVPIGDADILDGFVPSSPEKMREEWENVIRDTLITEIKMTEEEAAAIIQHMKGMEIEQACEYLEAEYSFYGAFGSYQTNAYHKGSMNEINNYLDDKLEDHSFSFFLSRKFADFAGLYVAFLAIILLFFLYIQDTKKNTYELLHTKPVSAEKYVLGKVLGGFITCCIVLGILSVIFYVVSSICTKGTGFDVYWWDFIIAVILYVLPNMLTIVCVYTIIALLFRTPLPAVPLLLMYVVYSNMGSEGANGIFGYYGRTFAIMVRFPGKFFDTAPPPLVFFNQIFLILLSMVIIFISAQLWKRRRT